MNHCHNHNKAVPTCRACQLSQPPTTASLTADLRATADADAADRLAAGLRGERS